MGKINLVNGSLRGQVGRVYGVIDKGHKVLKVVPFSHTPHNQTQKNAYSAFGCLQRVSSQIAKTFFQFLGLSAKTQSKINAVSHWLKPLVSNGTFSFFKFEDIIEMNGELTVENIEFDGAGQKFSLDFYTNFPTDKGTNPTVFFGFFDEQGKGLGATYTTAQSGHLQIATDYTDILTLNFVGFISYKKNGKWKQTGLVVNAQGGGAVVNGVWYPNRMDNGFWAYIGNGVVAGTNVNYTYVDGKLLFS